MCSFCSGRTYCGGDLIILLSLQIGGDNRERRDLNIFATAKKLTGLPVMQDSGTQFLFIETYLL